MKKQTKGAIAAAAAGVLLLGGAGSLALWNDSTIIGGNTISSGTMTLGPCAATGTGWTSANNTPISNINVAAWHVVPTEVLTYTCVTTVTAVGDRLKATISADTSAITGDAALKAALVPTVTLTNSGGAVSSITPAIAAVGPITVTVQLTFNDVTGLTAQNQSINLSALALNLKQNAIS